MSNILTEKPVVLVLAIAMIIILFVIGIAPLKAAYQTLTSVGDSESIQLTQEKDACNKIYEKDANAKGDCALGVAALLIDQNGDYFQAHAFLMKQIKNSASTQTNYEEALKLAKELYPKSKDWAGAVEFYYALLDRVPTAEVVDLAKSAILSGDLMHPPQGQTFSTATGTWVFSSNERAWATHKTSENIIELIPPPPQGNELYDFYYQTLSKKTGTTPPEYQERLKSLQSSPGGVSNVLNARPPDGYVFTTGTGKLVYQSSTDDWIQYLGEQSFVSMLPPPPKGQTLYNYYFFYTPSEALLKTK